MNFITNTLLTLGVTRDSLLWFWGRLVSGALLISMGLIPLDQYVSPDWQKAITVGAAIVLWLSGKYDSSPLPGNKKEK